MKNMTYDEFISFLDTHGVKDQFFDDVQSHEMNRMGDKMMMVDQVLQQGLSPFIHCIPDWGDCEVDWNHFDDLFDLGIRGLHYEIE